MTTQITVCPKCGQASSESDFCSECGARIESGATLVVAPAPAPSAAEADLCPSCQTPRPTPSARFCEVCRYDFVKQTAGEPPVVAPVMASVVASAPLPLAAPDPVAVPVAAGTKWDVVIGVDPSLDVEPDPQLQPPDEPERRIPLDRSENLIGRRDDKQSIVPDVRPHDPSVSRRQAKLLVQPDSTVAILDLESANGTFVNGEQILAGVPRALQVGDVVTMGRWTRLRIEPRAI
jgi:hypothetical protein